MYTVSTYLSYYKIPGLPRRKSDASPLASLTPAFPFSCVCLFPFSRRPDVQLSYRAVPRFPVLRSLFSPLVSLSLRAFMVPSTCPTPE
jgi:hypothetical protein